MVDIMRVNVEKVLQRGDTISDLQDKSEQLADRYARFFFFVGLNMKPSCPFDIECEWSSTHWSCLTDLLH